MCARNRSEGWRHAKLSGHENEDEVEALLLENTAFASRFLDRIGKSGLGIKSVNGGGLSETCVPSIFGGVTKSKSDIYVLLSNSDIVRVSLKKSYGGQVYLVTIANFIEAYEKHYGTIPHSVKRAIGLYWGSEPDVCEIVRKHGGIYKNYELRKNRLVAETLNAYDKTLAQHLINWFRDNIGNIADMCFARGAVSSPSDWAQFVWYKNELGEEILDDVFKIDEISSRSQKAFELVRFGNRMGGSTIQLPFGFVQWHSPSKKIPGCLQFHHVYQSVKSLFVD